MFTIFPVKRDGGVRRNHKFIGGVYLHGSLSDIACEDRVEINEVFMKDFENLSDGIYNISVYLDLEDKRDAILYFWKKKSRVTGICDELRGLICLPEDTEFIKDADGKFKCRAEWL